MELVIMEQDFKENLKKEVRELRERQIKQLEERKDRTENENYFLEMLKIEQEKRRTDEEIIRDNYYEIINLYDYWMDLKDEYRNIGSLWVIGTYLHEEFDSYPFLFINAMRGSGKSRFERLIKSISNNGEMLTSLTDAVLFRTKGTLCIDEFESIGSKEKQSLRELLNASYKKGVKVFRMRQKKGPKGTEQVVESFETYRPIVMANIWGMDEVLGDRAITLILEKSNDPSKTKLIENFDNNPKIKHIKNQFNLVSKMSLMSQMSIKEAIERWNNYTKTRNINDTNDIHTLTTLTTLTTPTTIKEEMFFNKIEKANISGRNLELFMPLFLIARTIGEDILDFTLKTAKNLIYEKKQDEEIESKDVMLIDFISKLPISLEFFGLKQITLDFKDFCDSGEEWLNEKWVGRALKRLNLVIDKRRISKGREVVLNIAKAQEKIKMFRTEKQGEEKCKN